MVGLRKIFCDWEREDPMDLFITAMTGSAADARLHARAGGRATARCRPLYPQPGAFWNKFYGVTAEAYGDVEI